MLLLTRIFRQCFGNTEGTTLVTRFFYKKLVCTLNAEFSIDICMSWQVFQKNGTRKHCIEKELLCTRKILNTHYASPYGLACNPYAINSFIRFSQQGRKNITPAKVVPHRLSILRLSSLMTCFWTFPETVLGNPSTNTTYLGILKWLNFPLQKFFMSS